MKKRSVFLIVPLLLLLICIPNYAQEKGSPSPSWSVYFSPTGGCTQAITSELNKAKSSILVQANSFTSAPIAKGLVAAHERGVKIEIILDKSNLTAQYTSGPFVAKAGIPTKIDSVHDIAHNKVMRIDEEIVNTGSFNFTKSAEDKNAENLLVIRDKATAEKYIKNWQDHEGHSEAYSGKSQQ